MTPGSDDDTSAQEELSEATARWRSAVKLAETLRRERAELMLRLHQQGASWEQIARATGSVSAGAAREWARQYAAAEEEALGVPVTEAARVLGVTPQTVYARIRAGRLSSVVDRNGKLRVMLQEG